MTTDQYVSILGSRYQQPISDLLEKWSKKNRHPSNAVQSPYFECGYATSIILLLAAMFESYVVRVRYLQRKTIPSKHRNAIAVMLYIYPEFRKRKSLTEVFVIRDLVFHNHLWELEYVAESNPSMVLKESEKHPDFGDAKYRDRVNSKTKRTKALGLSVIPTRVNMIDARKVFTTVVGAMKFLENQDRRQCNISKARVRHNNKSVLFQDLIGAFK